VTSELAVLDRLPAGADHVAMAQSLLGAGWSTCGVGDWAVVLASPSGELAARISPFDPTAPYTCALFRRAAATGQVPVLHAFLELEGGAVCSVMDRLHPVGHDEGAAFFRALAAREPEVADLVAAIDEVLATAREELPWCGPLDPNPANVMRRDTGALVLTDPFYADGPNLYGSILTDPMVVARTIPAVRRRHMLELPLAESGPWDPAEQERMRAALARADAELGQRRG
jgi:pimeloyl-ACP methyl ester carboxylesterase